MRTYRGATALVTGASAGIGAVFAEELAARGANLVLVARSEDKLRVLAERLVSQHNIKAEAIAADLSLEHAAAGLAATLRERGLSIDLLVNNAGAATFGRFDQIAPDTHHHDLMLNVVGLTDLTAQLLPAMIERRAGAIINVSSVAGFQPLPYMATYAASKAYILALSEALWAENHRHGIRVMTVCPGPTDTPMAAKIHAGNPRAASGPVPPQRVVALSLQALEQDKMTVIVGRGNFWKSQLHRFLPRRAVASISERILRPKASRA